MIKEVQNYKSKKITNLIILFFIIVIVTLFPFIPDKISQNDGLGYDGVKYGQIAKDFPDLIKNKLINNYYIQRILPSLLIHYIFKLFHIPLNNKNIINGFTILNNVCLVLIAFFWIKISDYLKIDNKNKVLGFIGLFINFAVLKWNFYYPVLTDTSAYAIGIGMLYFYLKDSKLGLLFSMLIGAFTWPTLFLSGALLYIFPVNRESNILSKNRIDKILSIIISLGLLLILLYAFIFCNYSIKSGRSIIANYNLIYISIAVLIIYIFLISSSLINVKFYIKNIFNSLNIYRIIPILILLLLIKFIIFYFGNGTSSLSIATYIKISLYIAIKNPLIFLVAHIVYFGPLIIVLVIYWGKFVKTINNYGIGLNLYILFYSLMIIEPESRHFINAYPFYLLFLILTIQKENWKNINYWIIGILSLIFSKVWFHIDTGTSFTIYEEFPAQRLFMNCGPWMSNNMYYLQGIIILITGIILYFTLKKGLQIDSHRIRKS